MSDDTTDDLTPNEQLAKQVADKLVGEGLIRADKLDEAMRGLAKGTLKSTDWRLLLELAADEEGEAHDAAD